MFYREKTTPDHRFGVGEKENAQWRCFSFFFLVTKFEVLDILLKHFQESNKALCKENDEPASKPPSR